MNCPEDEFSAQSHFSHGRMMYDALRRLPQGPDKNVSRETFLSGCPKLYESEAQKRWIFLHASSSTSVEVA
jgi:hypothetical protein